MPHNVISIMIRLRINTSAATRRISGVSLSDGCLWCNFAIVARMPELRGSERVKFIGSDNFFLNRLKLSFWKLFFFFIYIAKQIILYTGCLKINGIAIVSASLNYLMLRRTHNAIYKNNFEITSITINYCSILNIWKHSILIEVRTAMRSIFL